MSTLGKHLYHLIECTSDAEIELYLEKNVEIKYHKELREKFTSPPDSSLTKLIKKTVTASQDSLLIGDIVSSYCIKKKLDRGGMSNIYLASRIDGAIKKDVVIKVEDGFQNDRRKDNAEAQNLFDLSGSNENICTVYDAGITEFGQKYIVIEYIDGLTLDQYFIENKTSIIDILKFFITICETIGHIHQHNIIHGDIKPENILITNDGEIKIIDFGISSNKKNRVSISGATIDYAPPEQIKGEKLAIYSDVYSIGSTLYKILTGHKLFDHLKDDEYKITTILKNEPKSLYPFYGLDGLSGKHKYFSRDLVAIVKKCISFSPKDRYKGPFELSSDLRNFLDLAPLTEIKTTKCSSTLKLLLRNSWLFIPFFLLMSIILAGATLMFFQNKSLSEQKEHLIFQTNNLIIEKKSTETLLSQTQKILNYSDLRNRIGDIVDLKLLLDRGRNNINSNETLSREIKAKMLTVLGDSYFGLGEYPLAEDVYSESLKLYGGINSKGQEYLSVKVKILNSQYKNNTLGDTYIINETVGLLSDILSRGDIEAHEIDVVYLFSVAIRSSFFDIDSKERDLGFNFRDDVATIKKRLWSDFTPTQKVKMLNFQITEVYYRLGAGYSSATGSLDESEYEKAIPLLELIEGFANTGLNIIKENNLKDVLEVDMLVWLFRINYELKDYVEGDYYSDLATSKAIEIYGKYHKEIARLYKIRYAMHSSTDLQQSIEDILAAKDIASALDPNNQWVDIYYDDLLAIAYINAGDWEKSESISYSIIRAASKNDLDSITEEGLDGLNSTITRVFDFFDPSYLKDYLFDDLNKIRSLTNEFWPGWLNEVDFKTMQMLQESLVNDKEKTLEQADDIMDMISQYQSNKPQFNFFYKNSVCSILIQIYSRLDKADRISKAYDLYQMTSEENSSYLPSKFMGIQMGVLVYTTLKNHDMEPDSVLAFKRKLAKFIEVQDLKGTYYEDALRKL